MGIRFLSEFLELPPEARALVIYYTMAMVDGLAEIFLSIYMFTLGFPVELVGGLYSYLYFASAIASLIVGRLLDIKWSAKNVVILTEAIAVFEFLALYFARRPEHFIAAFTISAMATPFYVVYRTLERDLYPQESLEVAYKHHMFWPYFAQFVLSPIAGIVLSLDVINMYRKLLLAALGMCVLRAVYVWIVFPEIPPPASEPSEKPRGEAFREIATRELLLVSAAELIAIAAFLIAPLFVIENYLYNLVGVGVFGISLLYSLGGLMGALGAIIYDRLEGKGNRKLLVASLLSLSASSLAVYALNFVRQKLLLALAVFFVQYLANTVWWIIHECVMMRAVPESARGTVFGALSTARRLMSPAVVLLAVLLIGLDPLAPYVAQALLFLVAIPLYTAALAKEEAGGGGS